jgi:predicted acylesterase/phospholipase RssA
MTTDPGDADALKELRLALVCYGGVSLAVYMHGLAQELHRLVIASTPGKRASDGTQAVYRELLDDLAARDGVRTCVVIDIISGTSAGGINGVSLARALAQDGELTPVRDLWLEHADITKLLREEYRRLASHVLPTLRDVVPGLAKLHLPGEEAKPRNLLVRARDAVRATFTIRDDVAGVAKAGSVLHGDQLSYLIADGLRDISANGAAATLMPDGHRLDLFVTMTDRSGYAQHVPLGDQYVTEMANRHFNTFTLDEHRNDFAADTVDMLGFSGRATSSFPGAFEPISLDTFADDVGRAPAPSGRPVAWPPTQLERFYRVYALRLAEGTTAPAPDAEDEQIRRRTFVDGGVLDNYPFDHTIDEIRRRPAGRQTRRWLLYLEPDPMHRLEDELNVKVEQPSIRSMFSALKAAGSDIPLQEPIREQIKRLERMNTSARRLRDAIASTPLPTGPVDTQTPAFMSYLSWRLETVKRGLAESICRARFFPSETNQATAVGVIVDRWVNRRYPLSTGRRSGLNSDAVDFLTRLDIGHQRRRLRFLVDAVIELYPPKGQDVAARRPPRDQLDAAKSLLYRWIAVLDRTLETTGRDPEIADRLATLFPDSISRDLLGPPDDARGIGTVTASTMNALVDGEELGEVLDLVRARLVEGLGGLTFEEHARAGFEQLLSIARRWGDDVVADLRARFEWFEQWDMALYPAREADGVGEQDIVGIARMSPRDVWLLAPEGSPAEIRSFYEHKLKGTAFGHFGAFLEAAWRQNDYLWGRLDAAERLVRLVINDPDNETDVREYCMRLFKAILVEERDNVPAAPDTVDYVSRRIQRWEESHGAASSP